MKKESEIPPICLKGKW